MEYNHIPLIEIYTKYDMPSRHADHYIHHREDYIHVCEQIQIFYDVEEAHLITINSLRYQTKPGDLIIIQPWTPHRIQCLHENSKYNLIQFSPTIFESIAQIPHCQTDMAYWINQAGKCHTDHMNLNEVQRKRIEEFFAKYDSHRGFAMDLFRFSTFLETLAYICICLKRESEFKNGKAAKTTLSKKAMEYVEERFQEHILVSDIARHLFVTEKYLCSTFKKQTGFTIKQFISHCRIQKARSILYDVRNTPKDGFLQSGYSDYPTFLRMFKKIVGKTPTEYQKFRVKDRAQYPKEILDNVYKKPFPNRFLASVSPFLIENIEEPCIHRIVLNGFKNFFTRNVMQYDYKNVKVHFIGSIAYYYKEVLEEAALALQIELGTIIKSPMEGLVEFHSTL